MVTMSAYLKGEGITLAATRPLIWAMSASRCALTSSQTWAGRETDLSLRKTWIGIHKGSCPPRPAPPPSPTPWHRRVLDWHSLTDLSHACIVNEASIGTSASYDEPRSEKPSSQCQLVVVDEAGLGLDRQRAR